MSDFAQTLVVIPTYNESENFRSLADRILSLPSQFDLLIVDDGSPDGTAELVKLHAEFGKRIHMIERIGKQGLGTAYCAGFAWALERPYEWIAQMDADLSHEPADLERLLSTAKETDIAIGSRYIPGGGVQGWAKQREFLSRAANFYARTVLRQPVHDLTGGFKCYRRKAIAGLDLSDLRSEGYAFQIEITTRLLRKGFRAREIPILFRERQFGVSKISRNVIWEAFWLVLRLAN